MKFLWFHIYELYLVKYFAGFLAITTKIDLAKKREKAKEGIKKWKKESAEMEGKEMEEMEEGRYGNGRMEERDILLTKSTVNLVKCL